MDWICVVGKGSWKERFVGNKVELESFTWNWKIEIGKLGPKLGSFKLTLKESMFWEKSIAA